MDSRSRDLSAERRDAAQSRVDAFLSETRTTLAEAEITMTVVEGSAVAADVRLAGTDARLTASRVDLVIERAQLQDALRVLIAAGYSESAPVGDVELLRIANRSGRRPLHILVDADGTGAGGHEDDGGINGETRAESILRRSGRLRQALIPRLAVMRRTRFQHDDETGNGVTEDCEVGFVDFSDAPPPS